MSHQYPSNANICIDCKNAIGGCSWSEVNPETGKTAFIPVPGWTAKKSTIGDTRWKGKTRIIETYHITACPQFVRG